MMAEYWHFAEGIDETESRTFLETSPEPEMIHHLEIEARDFVNGGKASANIKILLKRLGVDSKILRRVAIASYEAEINIIAHSYGGTITANIYGDRVYIILQDQGPGVENLDKAMTPGWSTADEQVREMGFGAGLGLPNIKKNSDVMHIVSAKGENTRLEVIIYF